MPLSSKAGDDDRSTRRSSRRGRAPARRSACRVLVSELAYADRSTVDGFLTDDGLTLFFSSSPFQFPADAGPRPGDAGRPSTADRRLRRICYVAWRRSVDDPFSCTQPLDDLNTRRRRARSLADPRRQDALLHVRPRRAADHLHRRREAPVANDPARGAGFSSPGGCQPPSTTVGSRIIAASESDSCREPASRWPTLIAFPDASTLLYSQNRSDDVRAARRQQPARGRDRARHLAVDVGDVAGRIDAGVDARQHVAGDPGIGGQLRIDEHVAVADAGLRACTM